MLSTQPSKLSALEEVAPPTVAHQRNRRWSNWGQTAHCQPNYIFFPHSAEDLIEIVHFARNHGKQVRAVGSGHSWSALVPTHEVLVNVQTMNAVTMELADPANPCVIMESGATVREVNDILEAHGYALPFNVVLESVRFGGLISTGSHGSGWNHQTLSDLVEWIEVVTAAGELRRFEAGVDSDTVMNAVRLSLGMFGLVYQIKLRVQKSWIVHRQDRRVSVQKTLDNLAEWAHLYDNMDIFWWPFQDRFWVKTWHPTEGPITAKPRRNLVENVRSQIECQILRQGLGLLKPFPQLTRPLCTTTFLFTPSHCDQIVDLVEAVHYRRGIERVLTGCVEIAFKIDPDFSNVKWAIQLVLDEAKRHAERNQYPFNVTMNVRFIHNSDCLLSPAYGKGHTCYIEILSHAHQPKWEAFSGQIAREWLGLTHARPHWAKEFRHIPGVVDHIKREMGENIATFNEIKAQLGVDPSNMFMNDTLREIFLPA